MTDLLLPAVDLAAITILTFAIYLPRHRRRDLATAYLAVNAGVLAVTIALANSAATLGLGLGLFGVLSIIRLRSSELEQHEIAYYFSALALGLLGGLGSGSIGLTIALMAFIVLVLAVGDSPRLMRRHANQQVVLDRAIADHEAVLARLELLLGTAIERASVRKLDLVNDLTVVDVTYRVPTRVRRSEPAAPAPVAQPDAERASLR